MKSFTYTPNSLKEAGLQMRIAFLSPLESLPKEGFLRVWSSLFYLYPGLHPDGFDDAGSGWPRVLKRFAAEAWRRADDSELADDELYQSDAAWTGIYDRMGFHEEDETVRRFEMIAASGD